MKVTYREFIIILYILEIQKIYSDGGFVIIDNGSMGGTHWTCFIIKDNKKLP